MLVVFSISSVSVSRLLFLNNTGLLGVGGVAVGGATLKGW